MTLRARFLCAVAVSLVGGYAAVWLVLGLMVGFGDRFMRTAVVAYAPECIAGLGAIFVVCVFLRKTVILASRNSFLVGMFCTYWLFVMGCAAGLAVSALRFENWALRSNFLDPLWVLGLYGLIPALVVGFATVLVLRMFIPRVED